MNANDYNVDSDLKLLLECPSFTTVNTIALLLLVQAVRDLGDEIRNKETA